MSLEVQWLKPHLPIMQGVWCWSLVRDLWCPMTYNQKPKAKQKQYCKKFNFKKVKRKDDNKQESGEASYRCCRRGWKLWMQRMRSWSPLNKCPLSQAMGRRKRVQKKPVASDGAKSSLPHHAGSEAWAALGLWGLSEAGDCHFTLRLALPWSPQDGRMEDGSKNEEHLK